MRLHVGSYLYRCVRSGNSFVRKGVMEERACRVAWHFRPPLRRPSRVFLFSAALSRFPIVTFLLGPSSVSVRFQLSTGITGEQQSLARSVVLVEGLPLSFCFVIAVGYTLGSFLYSCVSVWGIPSYVMVKKGAPSSLASEFPFLGRRWADPVGCFYFQELMAFPS